MNTLLLATAKSDSEAHQIPPNFDTGASCMRTSGGETVILRIPSDVDLSSLHGLEIDWPPSAVPTTTRALVKGSKKDVTPVEMDLHFGQDNVAVNEVGDLMALFPKIDAQSPFFYACPVSHVGTLARPLPAIDSLIRQSGERLLNAVHVPVPMPELEYRVVFDAFGSTAAPVPTGHQVAMLPTTTTSVPSPSSKKRKSYSKHLTIKEQVTSPTKAQQPSLGDQLQAVPSTANIIPPEDASKVDKTKRKKDRKSAGSDVPPSSNSVDITVKEENPPRKKRKVKAQT